MDPGHMSSSDASRYGRLTTSAAAFLPVDAGAIADTQVPDYFAALGLDARTNPTAEDVEQACIVAQ